MERDVQESLFLQSQNRLALQVACVAGAAVSWGSPPPLPQSWCLWLSLRQLHTYTQNIQNTHTYSMCAVIGCTGGRNCSAASTPCCLPPVRAVAYILALGEKKRAHAADCVNLWELEGNGGKEEGKEWENQKGCLYRKELKGEERKQSRQSRCCGPVYEYMVRSQWPILFLHPGQTTNHKNSLTHIVLSMTETEELFTSTKSLLWPQDCVMKPRESWVQAGVSPQMWSEQRVLNICCCCLIVSQSIRQDVPGFLNVRAAGDLSFKVSPLSC